MEIKYISGTPLTAEQNPITLALIKQYLRITHDEEDIKIQHLINSGISIFEQRTRYYLRETTLQCRFTLRDAYRQERRSDPTIADYFGPKPDFGEYTLGDIGNLNTDFAYTFKFPVGIVSNQKPVSLKIYDSNGDLVHEGIDNLADNFIFAERTKPLKARLQFGRNKDAFAQGLTNLFLFEMEIKTDRAPFSSDISQGLIRMICQMYEQPDGDYMQSDVFSDDIFYRYDMNSSI